MYGVEFQTTIKNGIIEIPPEYRQRFKDDVRIILLSEVLAQTLPPKFLRPFGLAGGEFRVPDDFDAALPESIVHEFEGQ